MFIVRCIVHGRVHVSRSVAACLCRLPGSNDSELNRLQADATTYGQLNRRLHYLLLNALPCPPHNPTHPAPPRSAAPQPTRANAPSGQRPLHCRLGRHITFENSPKVSSSTHPHPSSPTHMQPQVHQRGDVPALAAACGHVARGRPAADAEVNVLSCRSVCKRVHY